MSKKYFLGFNWKMNPNNSQTAKELFLAYKQALSEHSNSKEPSSNFELALFPPSLYLGILQENLNLENEENPELQKLLNLGSQDISKEESGAFTSEISAKMLSDLKIKYTLVGHSETRELNSLSDQILNQKVHKALENNISPVLCIGYSKSLEIDFDELQTQVLEGLKGCEKYFSGDSNKQIPPSSLREATRLKGGNFSSQLKIILAYEPVWAIGSGKAADLATVDKVLKFLRELINQKMPLIKDKVQILYGGSVSDKNVLELTESEFLDGFLIGGASLEQSKFEPILHQLANS